MSKIIGKVVIEGRQNFTRMMEQAADMLAKDLGAELPEDVYLQGDQYIIVEVIDNEQH